MTSRILEDLLSSLRAVRFDTLGESQKKFFMVIAHDPPEENQ